MLIYISAYDKAHARDVREQLLAAGHKVIASWLDSQPPPHPIKLERTGRTPAEKAADAQRNLEDLLAADVVLVLGPGCNTPGGMHFECGFAMAVGMPIYLLGEPWHMYNYHARIQRLDSLEQFLAIPPGDVPVVPAATARAAAYNADPTKCPFCGSADISSYQVVTEGTGGACEADCDMCGSEWQEQWQFAGMNPDPETQCDPDPALVMRRRSGD